MNRVGREAWFVQLNWGDVGVWGGGGWGGAGGRRVVLGLCIGVGVGSGWLVVCDHESVVWEGECAGMGMRMMMGVCRQSFTQQCPNREKCSKDLPVSQCP